MLFRSQRYCIKDGELPSDEPVPVRYSTPSLFIGWITENGVPYDMYKPIYEDITFYATWLELPTEETADEGNENNGSTY